jgi:hypothetical protein
MGIGDWGLGIGPNPQSPLLKVLTFIKQFVSMTIKKIKTQIKFVII